MLDTRKFVEKSRSLLEDGRSLLRAAEWDGHAYGGEYPATGPFIRIRTEALNLIGRSCGQESEHYRELRRIVEADRGSGDLPEVLGVIEAAIHDLEGGFLFDVKSLVTAEVLSGFMDQAEALLKADYYVPAASLAGAVLEDCLRKLCDRRDLSLPDRPGIDRLNVALAKLGVYDKLTQKRVTHLADLRNKADHGEFDKVGRDDVEDMVRWVRRFAADYLR